MQMEIPSSPSPLKTWRERFLPEPGWPAGYASLIDAFDLLVPAPPQPAMVAERHNPADDAEWQVFSRRLKPDDTLEAQLEFALKYEGLSLATLKALYRAVGADAVASYVREKPNGKYARRVWFLYEWLTGDELDIPELTGRPRAVDIVDEAQQVGLGGGELSTRHRVRNNLPGTPAFCPMVRWTSALRSAAGSQLKASARRVIGQTHPDVIGRAAAFLLLHDSRSSFEIEGERPSVDRTQRWGRAIAEAGSRDLSLDELIRLQRIVIGDDRFVELGLREDGGFVGDRDRITGVPMPKHISARPEDLRALLAGLLRYERRSLKSDMNAVVAAAVMAFGFVYIHPFVDGNGRIHRWLIHHILARADFHPPELPFPVSTAILRHIGAYRTVLESYSLPLLGVIDWEATDRGNVRVLNDTADFYRFFDATAHAEFLYRCVQETVVKDLPREVAFLKAYDRFTERVQQIVDMPAGTIDLLHRFLHQQDGSLSKRARRKEFANLTKEEAAEVERIFRDVHRGS